ncbi:hypothetical protein [Anaerostipes hadrus]|nr:hypothetical protein [Anaerostipes hadrus]
MNPRNCSNRKSSTRSKKENANDKLLKWIKYFDKIGRLKREENKK